MHTDMYHLHIGIHVINHNFDPLDSHLASDSCNWRHKLQRRALHVHRSHLCVRESVCVCVCVCVCV